MNTEETATQQTRTIKILQKASERTSREIKKNLHLLSARKDHSCKYDYFLNLFEGSTSPEAISNRVGLPVMRLLCIQAPLELIHAAGFHPFKIFSGSASMTNLASQGLPALMCPMLRAVLGAVQTGEEDLAAENLWILPTTCDWVVKFPEMASLAGVKPSAHTHWMELPHLKDGDSAQKRWLEEVFGLKKFLEALAGKLSRKALVISTELYQRAWRALIRAAELRQEGRLANVWFMLMANSFFFDSVERWTAAMEQINPRHVFLDRRNEVKVFLAGSPIFFPNFKLPFLLEEEGISVAADDLCSSERIFPGAVTYSDLSEFGIISAAAQRYHQGCLCPTFIDNDRRVNNILGRKNAADFKGVVFHVLKGCHPYDLESFGLERALKERGLKFIRLETDYAAEDGANLSTRLEAYRGTLADE
jgi:benzoyl-CoA reductase/2-hydroxyglutaryl-CoA dehydratase subunit BcrC/BadD/HgdB